MIEIGEVLLGTYRIEREIGRGGMGVVYEASHLRLLRRFAVKIIDVDPGKRAHALERFKREALITSALGHHNIVEVIDFNSTEKGAPFLVMELLEGEDLGGRVRRKGRLSLDEAVEIFRQAAQALQAAHDKGVVHRDLKPSNIYLCRREERDDFVKVLDFGVSKMLGVQSSLTKSNTILGTPYYMSPEQADEGPHEVDQRTDVFAMGIILYEMLTGQPPFRGKSIPSVLYKVVHHPAPALLESRHDLPSSLEQVYLHAVEKDPIRRFSSMAWFWHELAEAVGHQRLDLSTPVANVVSQSPPAASTTSSSLDATLPPPTEFLAGRGASASLTRSGLSRRRWAALILGVLLVLGGSLLLFRRVGGPEMAAIPPAPGQVVPAADARQVGYLQRDLDSTPASGRDTIADRQDTAGDSAVDQLHALRRPRGRASATMGISVLADGTPVPADVIINGEQRGQAPLEIKDLVPGRYLIEVHKDGFQRAVKSARLARGMHLRLVIPLKRLP